ncbi:MAG: S8 family serine peptidase, partial [Gaiellaceae bacterium]
MRMRRVEPGSTGPLALLAVAATIVLVAAGGGGAGQSAAVAPEGSWAGLVGGARPRVSVGQRVLVVLKDPSVADRIARAGGAATEPQERSWSRDALAAQRKLTARLGVQGVLVKPKYSYTRTLNGFSAAIEARGISLLESAPEVAGVYPVRAAYPASIGSSVLAGGRFGPGSGHRAEVSLPGYDGRGITIALLDTGVDRSQPYLRGRVVDGIDIVGTDDGALAAPSPADPGLVEEHGTQMAGILVGAGGPSGLSGVATGASVMPIRVAGWQPDASGHWAVYARTDQIVAGLERAVDPNGDGDTHDAARLALIALAAPYAAFADDPVARAAAGALRLDTLVVTAGGNDGSAGPGFGSISGPGGAPAALTVGAADMRVQTDRVRLVVRSGLDVIVDRPVSLGGAVRPTRPVTAQVVLPRPAAAEEPPDVQVAHFFDRRGYSIVAGRATLVAAGSDARAVVTAAAAAGAAAVLLDGSEPPAGSLGLDERVGIPVVGLSAADAHRIRAALSRGARVAVSLGGASGEPNLGRGRVASFSSSGLAFDGR